MAARTRNASLDLQAAMALLIRNQAAFEASQIKSAEQWKETEKTFMEIRKELDAIKAILARHELILQALTDAIRQKIGFKGGVIFTPQRFVLQIARRRKSFEYVDEIPFKCRLLISVFLEMPDFQGNRRT